MLSFNFRESRSVEGTQKTIDLLNFKELKKRVKLEFFSFDFKKRITKNLVMESKIGYQLKEGQKVVGRETF